MGLDLPKGLTIVSRLDERLNHFRLIENFLYSGISALLLSLTQIYPELRILAVVALAPLLIRVININLVESIVCGIMLALSLAMVLAWGELIASPATFLIKLGLLSLVFSLFAAAVTLIKRRFGFNPIFIAFLWIPVEYVLKNHIGLAFAFTPVESGGSFWVGISSLFGLLFVSYIIILINSLIVAFIRYVSDTEYYDSIYKSPRKIPVYRTGVMPVRSLCWYYLCNPRSPPLIPKGTFK